MTETTDLLNAGEVVESGGKAYTLSHVGPGIRADFSAALMARARQGLRDERKAGTLSASEYREEADALKARFDAGAYAWGSPLDPNDMGAAIQAALNETWGKLKLAQLLLKAHHGEMTLEEVADMLKGNPEAIGDAIEECLSPSPNAAERDRRRQKKAKERAASLKTNGTAPAA